MLLAWYSQNTLKIRKKEELNTDIITTALNKFTEKKPTKKKNKKNKTPKTKTQQNQMFSKCKMQLLPGLK